MEIYFADTELSQELAQYEFDNTDTFDMPNGTQKKKQDLKTKEAYLIFRALEDGYYGCVLDEEHADAILATMHKEIKDENERMQFLKQIYPTVFK